MKKIVLVSVLALSTMFVNAQVTFGVKGGVNFATLGGDDADELEGKKSNTGFYLGGTVNVPISSNFAFQPELIYSANQGMEFRESPLELNYNLGYLNIPLMLQYRNSGFIAEAGPQIGFLMSAKAKISDGTNTDEEDIKDEFKGTDFGVNLGLGYQFSNGFGLNARYTFGMSNIIDETDVDVKNRVFSVGVFFNFGGKKSKD
ncbi:MAG TPA: porin family protein [Chitinophagaceae bacterium]|nr:porin family protein [Chitinophagaceae bacterium]